MYHVAPLSFKLPAEGEESIDIRGVRSVDYKMVGQLHLTDRWLVFEWTGTRTTEKVGFDGIGTDVERLPLEEFEIPLDHIVGARLVRTWWLPRLEIRARTLDLFDEIPGSKPGMVSLRIKRRDRAHAFEFVLALENAIADAALTPGDEVGMISDGGYNTPGAEYTG